MIKSILTLESRRSTPDLHGPFLLSCWVFIFIFSLFSFLGACARLSWPSRQLLSAR